MTLLTAEISQFIARERLEALRFDAFQLLPRRRVLLHHGRPVPIGGRAFDLLLLLATRPGEVIPNTELIATVWSNRVVSYCNLKTQIGTLQKLLGLAPCGERYIKNVALRGYVFVSDVCVVATARTPEPEIHIDRAAATLCH